MKQEQLERTIGLIGEKATKKLEESTILLCGLGGVGGTALEALVRTGIGHFIIVDFDKVASSNLNRQILYTQKDIGRSKVEAAKERILSINNEAFIDAIEEKVDISLIKKLNNYHIDFIIDAIDDVLAKVELAKYASENHIPYISSLGMANRFNATDVIVTRLDKTTGDPLAKKLRYEFKKAGIDTKNIIVSFSKEQPIKDGVKLNSIMMPPSSSGLAIASYVIQELIKGD
ncbi:MAG: ThiF family adenylyltransferase [Bacilli bacterium]|nr:ThiF family adenylyltransferase [Bacilli bacterium]